MKFSLEEAQFVVDIIDKVQTTESKTANLQSPIYGWRFPTPPENEMVAVGLYNVRNKSFKNNVPANQHNSKQKC